MFLRIPADLEWEYVVAMLQRHALDNSTTGFVDCVSDDPQIAYYRRRAVECSTAAKNASDRDVAKVHEQFVIEYTLRADRLGSSKPMPQSAFKAG